MLKVTALFALASAAAAAPLGYLQEVTNEGATAICDSVKQYSGYYKLTTGDKVSFPNVSKGLRSHTRL
jgi:hypothetical protein